MEREKWEKLKEVLLGRRTVFPNLVVFLLDILLLWASLYFSPFNGGNRVLSGVLSVLLLTLFMVHVYLLKHEASHSALTPIRGLNNAFGHLFGWVILMPFLARQRSHLLHHSWTGHPERDPSNQRLIQGFKVMTQRQAKRLELIWKLTASGSGGIRFQLGTLTARALF
jgi:omega-6 fatty acid desaturase (delta-12 desaturase)